MQRRTFLIASGTLGLVVGWCLLPPRQRLDGRHPLAVENGEIALNGWIKLTPDGTAVVAMPRSEMGQGVMTGIAMIAAEELDLPLDRVRLVQAPPDRIFGNVKLMEDGLLPLRDDDQAMLARSMRWMVAKGARELGWNTTGASSTIKDLWLPLREAAAQARASLVEACATMKGVSTETCRTEGGFVVLTGGARIPYGEIVRTAQPISAASRYSVKEVKQFKLVGTSVTRVDARDCTDGRAVFGIDVRLPNMGYAALVMAPSVGAKLQPFTAPAGIAPIRIPAGYGQDEALAVVADSWWEASRMAESLEKETKWDESAGARADSAAIQAAQGDALDREAGRVYYEAGDVAQAFKRAAQRIDATYTAPYLAHGTLEPMNCTAWISDGKVRVWAPTQAPTRAAAVAAKVAGVSKDAVELTVTRLGGGFGRRLEVDFVAQAVAIAMKTEGRPVQMIWTRPQDMTHDMYRPAATCRLSAGIDGNGRIVALETKLASDRVGMQWLQRVWPGFPDMPDLVPDRTTMEGLFDTPYLIPNQRHAHVAVRSALPVGNFRSVGHSLTGFFMESFIDELAAQLKKDPLVLRRELLASKPRHLAVLNLAAEKSGYSEAKQRALKAQGRALGLAIHESFSSIVAHVAEVSVEGKTPRVHRVVSAVDVGLVVNPDLVAQQIEGAVIMGLSAALYGRIDVEKGRVRQQYFTAYPLLSIVDAPVVETHIVRSQEPPHGAGEPGLPAIAPAVANALFALDPSERRRSLPLASAAPGAHASPWDDKEKSFACQVNGKGIEVDVKPGTPLLWLLRDRLNLTGTKFGCGVGICRACTVLVGADALPSCLLTASQVRDMKIYTIEGVGSDPVGKALQDTWVANNVPQCGYCQSGQIMRAIALLKGNPDPDDRAIDDAMGDNVCRCGTYQRIRAAIKQAARAIGK